jgi:hypothetical protein
MTTGDRVKHRSAPDWGIGQVLGPPGGGKVKIFFAKVGVKLLTLSASLATVQGEEASDPTLDNLALDPERLKSYKTLVELKKRFLGQFPGGFRGSSYQVTERDYKVEAHQLATTLFTRSGFERSIASNNHAEICENAKRAVQATNLVFPNEKIKFRDGLKSERARVRFAQSLYDLLFDERSLEPRFANFCQALEEMDADKWTLATYFLFIFKPEEYMFMKPLVTIRAAEICAFELNYNPQPNWFTYRKLLMFAQHLKNELRDLEPRDMIDVQSFIWCTGEERGS